MVVRSKRKRRFVIGNTSPDASMHKVKSQDMELMSMNVTENVCYDRIHVQNDVSYERVLVPGEAAVYNIIPGGADSHNISHIPPANEVVGTAVQEYEHI